MFRKHGRLKAVISWLPILLAGGASACVERVTAPAAVNLGDAAKSIRVPEPTPDDFLERVGSAVPGFVGYWYADGVLTLGLTDQADHRIARETLTALGIRHANGRPLDFTSAPVVSRPHSFKALRGWERRLADHVGGIRLVSADIDERRGLLHYRVRDVESLASLRAVTASLGVPTTAFLIELSEAMQRDTSLDAYAFNPIPGAVAFQRNGSSSQCTIGFNVVHETWGQSFVSAAHCTSTEWGAVGDSVHQPVVGYATFAVERVDPAGSSALTGCYPNYICRGSDAALFQYLRPWEAQQGYIARTPVGVNEIDTSNPRTPVYNSYHCDPMFGWCSSSVVMGSALEMTGAFSGRTTGTLSSSCEHYYDGNKQLVCQNGATYSRMGGDSGAPVLLTDGNIAGVHSGHIGTLAVFSAMTSVMSELGANMTAPCASFNVATWCM